MTQASQQPNPAEMYERFVAQGLFTPWTEDLLERAAPKPGERVLDLACGTGIVTRRLVSKVGKEGRVVGLDIAPPMLEVARTMVPTDGAPVEFRQGSGTEMPLEDGMFDLVTCQQGLQFFPDHAAGLREIKRVLASGGRAVVSVWRDLEKQRVMKSMEEVLSKRLGPGALDPPMSLSDETLLEKLARDAGFTRVKVEQVHKQIRIADPENFVPMMLQSSAAVLPAFRSMEPDARMALIAEMGSDVSEALRPLIQNGELVHDAYANVLTAWV